MKKLTVYILCIISLLSIITGCSNEKESQGETESNTKYVEELKHRTPI